MRDFWRDLTGNKNGPIEIGLFSFGIRRIPSIKELIAADKLHYRPVKSDAPQLTAIMGWGNKPSTQRARAYARENALPFVALEDGWIRSLGLEGRWSQTLSVVLDDVGIYYDARQASRLENLISEADFDNATLERARSLRKRIVDSGISKYNHAPVAPELPAGEKVLVVDQTFGDQSIEGGLADADRFQEMLAAALEQHPDADVYLKVHPEVVAGRKKGHFDIQGLPPRVRVLGQAMNPIGLLRQVDHVYVVSSQLGFEALMLEKPVTCFGMPFYAGWGLTKDHVDCERRNTKRSLDQVFAAAYLAYVSYLNPVTGQVCTLEALLDFLQLQLRWHAENRGRLVCIGFRYWKRYIVRAFVQGPDVQVVFFSSLDRAKTAGLSKDDKLLFWSSRIKREDEAYCQEQGLQTLRMEDGFLRSVGLGSDFVTPLSLVLDSRGIYYDPDRASDLEHILNTAEYDEAELQRAAKLCLRIKQTGATKYNLVGDGKLDILAASGKRKILVPGQVEDDASVKSGGGDIQSNLALLKAVRADNPDAYILFKPHPDVVAGNRKDESSEAEMRILCDAYERGLDMNGCLQWADEVHTLTSLSGFEALLRGKSVTTYGAPFYAGWGLTADRQPFERRNKMLTLEALVAGVLIRYPRYYDWKSRYFIGPEQALESLISSTNRQSPSKLNAMPLLKHVIIKVRQLMNIIRYS